MTLLELIEKHDTLSAAGIARKIGMSRGVFNNKVRGNNGSKFTGPEMVKILAVLDEINKDLRTFITSV